MGFYRLWSMRWIISLCLSVMGSYMLVGQTPLPPATTPDLVQVDTSLLGTETILKQKKGSIFQGRPGKALLYSLVIPGTGQIYNKSYIMFST